MNKLQDNPIHVIELVLLDQERIMLTNNHNPARISANAHCCPHTKFREQIAYAVLGLPNYRGNYTLCLCKICKNALQLFYLLACIH